MSFLRYALFRLALAVPVVFGILVLTFLLTHVLPTDPAVNAAGAFPTDENIAHARRELGLDKPIWTQLWDYLAKLAHGDLGESAYTGANVRDDLLDRLPSTLVLITLSMIVACVVGTGIAILSADRRGILDWLGRFYGSIGTAVPDYFFAILLISIFYATLGWLPEPVGQAGTNAPPISRVTGVYFADALIARNGAAIAAGFTHLILPVAALGLIFAAPIYRIARGSIEEVRGASYVLYLRIMGSSSRYVQRCIIRNALPPIMTISGIIYSHLLAGAVLVETIFGWGGVGQYAIESVRNNDYYAIQGFVLFAAFFSVATYLVVDLAHAALDPRTRRGL